MTPKMREVIQQAGYRFCTNCWGEGTDSREKSITAQGRLSSETPLGCTLPQPCTVCHGDGIVKEDLGGVPIT